MTPAKRIIVNTLAQYVKSVLNICLSLYSTRLILNALSISDFGIYAVVGGVVALLGFISNSLVVTTQRFISFYHGRGDRNYVARIFTNSLLLHVVFGLAIGIVLVFLKGWLFGGVLNIPAGRVETAGYVYYITIAMLFVTVCTAPFRAVFIARENIVYVSVVEVCDGIFKLLLAIALTYMSADRLLVYVIMMCGIQVANFFAFSLFGCWKFQECSFAIRRRDLSRTILRKLLGFAGWTIYSMGTLAARNQGIAVVINHFVGTVANAAYGVAAQVNAAVFFVSTSIVNAMNPQIMKAEGEGDRQRMLWLAGQESKFSTILLLLASVPIMCELPSILSVWLDTVPDNTAMFCTFTLAACLFDQLTIGLHTANRAQGKIALFTFLMFTPKLLCLPIAWWLLKTGHSLDSVMWVVLITEGVTSVSRIPYLKFSASLDVWGFLRQSILPVLPLAVALLVCGLTCIRLMHFPFRFMLSIPLSVLIGLAVVWRCSLESDERQYVTNIIKSKLSRT